MKDSDAPLESAWPDDGEFLCLAHRANRCTVLGPGIRAVLWVQGCPHRCPGCIAPEMLPFEGGRREPVSGLVEDLVLLTDVDGVTFSGWEPMAQARALARLIDQIRSRHTRPLSFLAYTGYTLEELRQYGTKPQRELLARLDILIDGPYVQSQHTTLRWRGSSNQRIHYLTERGCTHASGGDTHVTGLEFAVGVDGSVFWMGIPPRGFRARFERAMAARGIDLA